MTLKKVFNSEHIVSKRKQDMLYLLCSPIVHFVDVLPYTGEDVHVRRSTYFSFLSIESLVHKVNN